MILLNYYNIISFLSLHKNGITYIIGSFKKGVLTMNIKCEIQEKTSKLGKKYYVLYIPDLEKYVFLNNTEVKLLELIYNKQ